MGAAVNAAGAAIAAFLRAGGRRGMEWRELPQWLPSALILLCGGLYGAIMAGYHGVGDGRAWMIVYGAVKAPLLFGVTLLLAVPCFYVVNALVGVGDDFRVVWNGLVDYQISAAVQLAAIAPVTLFVNAAFGDYRLAQLWSTLIFAVAAWNAQRSLHACYRPLIRKNPKHRVLLRFWVVIYAFVGIQMGWNLRPFIGHPDMAVEFFRKDFGNAYVEVFRVLWPTLRGLFTA